MWNEISRWIGPDDRPFDLEVHHMVVRAVIVFAAAVLIARVGSKRFMARNSAFDLILAIMLGSVLSRAITGQSPFLPTLIAGACLVGMHALVAFLAFRFRGFSWMVKGRARALVENGKVDENALRHHLVGEGDLLEALRMRGGGSRLDEIETAHLERNGEISMVLKNDRSD